MSKKMVEKLSWEDFKKSGLLWFVNRTLHLFGRAICFDYYKNGKLKEVYFARCKFRGFTQKIEDKGFKNVYKYIKSNINEIEKDLNE